MAAQPPDASPPLALASGNAVCPGATKLSAAPPRLPDPPVDEATPSDLSHVAVVPDVERIATRWTVKPGPLFTASTLPTKFFPTGCAAEVNCVEVPPMARSVKAIRALGVVL